MQFQQLHQHQIEMDSLSSGNLSSIQPALRHLIDFITVQHQVGCESVMLVKKDVLILNGQKLVQGMQVHKQLMLQIMSEGIAAHHLLCLFVQLAIDKNQWLIKMAMFEQPTLKDTIQVLTEVQPLVAEDAEMSALVQQTIPKMQQLNEQQFKGLELEWHRPEDDAGK